MKPLITVITITFNLIKANREKTFRQCVKSIRDQTYKNIEHIIIDGASTDGTIKLLEEYSQKGWIKYYSEPDNGIYNAFNKGIDKANGKYIVFVNSDDYYHSKKGVEKSVKALLENDADYSYADDYILNEKKPYKSKTRKAKIHRIFFRMPFCHQTMFTKKSVLEEIGKFDESFKSAGDYDLLMKLFLARKYKGVFVKHNFCTFRMGGESNLNEETSHKECVRIFQKHYEKFYPITKLQAIKMFCDLRTPFPLLLRLLSFFKKEQKLYFWLFYTSKVIHTYRKQLIQFRASQKGKSGNPDKRFRFFKKFFIKPVPKNTYFHYFREDGYIE